MNGDRQEMISTDFMIDNNLNFNVKSKKRGQPRIKCTLDELSKLTRPIIKVTPPIKVTPVYGTSQRVKRKAQRICKEKRR